MLNEESVIAENNENVVEEIANNNEVSKDILKDNFIDYLSKNILDVRTYSEEELSKIDKEKNDINIDNDLYSNNISDIQERQVVNGVVVGTNDKGVIIDIGFKSEGLIDKNEFTKLPDVGDEVDVLVVFNEYSYETHKNEVKENGFILYDSDQLNIEPSEEDWANTRN